MIDLIDTIKALLIIFVPIVVLLATIPLGRAAICSAAGKESENVDIGSCLLVGIVSASFLFYILHLTNMQSAGLYVLAIIIFGFFADICILRPENRAPCKDHGSRRLFALGVFAGIFLLWLALTSLKPIEWFDAVAFWALRGKMAFYGAPFEELGTAPNNGYPVLVPYMLAFSWAGLGSANDLTVKYPQLVMALGMLYIIRRFFDQYRLFGHRAGLPVAAMIGLCPYFTTPLVESGGAGDMPLTILAVSGVLNMLLWFDGKRAVDFISSVILLSACAFTKNDGQPIMAVGIVAIALVCYQKYRSDKRATGLGLGHEDKKLYLNALAIMLMLVGLWKMCAGIHGWRGPEFVHLSALAKGATHFFHDPLPRLVTTFEVIPKQYFNQHILSAFPWIIPLGIIAFFFTKKKNRLVIPIMSVLYIAAVLLIYLFWYIPEIESVKREIFDTEERVFIAPLMLLSVFGLEQLLIVANSERKGKLSLAAGGLVTLFCLVSYITVLPYCNRLRHEKLPNRTQIISPRLYFGKSLELDSLVRANIDRSDTKKELVCLADHRNEQAHIRYIAYPRKIRWVSRDKFDRPKKFIAVVMASDGLPGWAEWLEKPKKIVDFQGERFLLGAAGAKPSK